jgi:CHAT domain-containing protein
MLSFINYRYLWFCLFLGILLFSGKAIADNNGTDIEIEPLIKQGEALCLKGDFRKAAGVFKQVISQIEPYEDPVTYINSLIYLSYCYQALGAYNEALDSLQYGVPLIAGDGDYELNAMLLSSIGDVYLAMGNISEAVNIFEKALAAAQKSEDPLVNAMVLNNIANVLAVDGDLESAISLYEQCLELIKEKDLTDNLELKIRLNLLRAIIKSEKETISAELFLETYQHIEKMPDSHHKAGAMISLAESAIQLFKKEDPGSKQKLDFSQQALFNARKIAIGINDQISLAYALGYIGHLYEVKGLYKDAVSMTRKAVFVTEQQKRPEILYKWQWQLARLFEIQDDLEKAEKSYKNAIETLSPIRKSLFIGYRGSRDIFNTDVKPLYLQLARLLLNQSELEKDKFFKNKKIIEARDTMELLKSAELENFFKDECVTAINDKDKTMEYTEPGTAVIYPIALEEKLAIILMLPDGIKYFQADITSKQLKAIITQFRKKLQTRTSNRFLNDAQTLYNWILGPIEDEFIKQQINTLVIAPDGVLRLIPFSTLHDGNVFLIEKYAIGIIPAIMLTDQQTMDLENVNVLVSGLSEGRQGFSPLPSVKDELLDIKKMMDSKSILMDKSYTVENLTNELKHHGYGIIHIATHGVFGGTPQDTFLLAYNKKLNMDHLEKLIALGKYRKEKVELLTLSACQTALGDERAALGLAGVAVKAGVKSVIATLWYVDDESTSLAIREYYRQLKIPGNTKAMALQKAQKKLINQPRYWHPLYWAPYVLIGNWQ